MRPGEVRSLALSFGVLVLAAGPAWAEKVLAPNGAYVLDIGKAVVIIDPGGAGAVPLIKSVVGARRVDAKWSSDSRRVVVVVNYDRGSGVFAAWNDGSRWHKTVELDEDLPVDELARQGGASGRLVAENRKLGEWLSPERIRLTGDLIFSGGKRLPYAYTLEFGSAVTKIDAGGYEEGIIRGIDWHVR